ncbi:Heavy-metal-associated domain-containing protein [Aspergillus sp. HF37]|nr:Heavy-metal-associated domain-containing protein [Aspergillus sp. HF37]
MAPFTPLSRMPAPQSPEPASLKSIFLVLSEISAVSDIDVSIFTHEVRVHHSPATDAPELATRLIQAAFEVHHVTTFDSRGAILSELDTTSWLSRNSKFFPGPRSSSCSAPSSENKLHIANCDACRKEEYHRDSHPSDVNEKDPTRVAFDGVTRRSTRESDTESLVEHVPSIKEHKPPGAPPSTEEFNALISIGGMSCSSCVNAITAEVQGLEYVKEVNVNLLTNSAKLVYTGPRSNIEKIIECIEDIGFEASLDQANDNAPASRAPEGYVAELAIGGMTCGSCVGTVTSALEQLPFVTEASVNLMSSSARVEYKAQDNIGAIIEKVEDLGYDASLSSVQPLAASDDGTSTTRTLLIRVDGMFCHHCPEKVVNSLKEFPDVEIEEVPTVKNPILKVTYNPRPSLTIRSILAALDAAHDSFTAGIYHPPTIEDRSRAIQQHERRRLLSRLIFVFIVTIPTFLIGIVFMSLVSSDNPTRIFLDRPVWAGSASRAEWALFIMTTPVMVYGTDVFHVRALKEIYTLWRPGSRVPILRRLYRFGSMNLLISAGTTVAYFSSLAVLILDAAVGAPSGSHSSTHFDSVTFLTLFILAGRFLEAYSKAKTGDAVSSLGKLRPSEALLVDEPSSGDQNTCGEANGVRRVNVDLLEIGDAVSIPHGASPPADGMITAGGSYQFDESSLTGESKPVKKSTGDPVYTGSVNVGQPVQIKLSELGGSSMLDRIITVVREGQSKRAPMERIADVLTSHFVPAITLIAISTFVIWLALGLSGALPADYLDVERGGWTFWALQFAIAVFVVACPCGLALAAPTALFVGGGLAARNGILVKGGGEAFQEASRLNAIVFDKTGTLTEGGSLKVSDHEILSKDSELHQVAWAVARKLEESSNHPMARAITEFCNKESASVLSSDIHEIPGHGMKGTFSLSTGTSESEKHTVQYEAAIGNERLLHQVITPDADTYYLSTLLSKYQSTGKSTAILSLRKADPKSPNEPFSPAMVFATSDLIRPEAAQVVSKLRSRNVDVFMCTGDNTTTAHAVADMLGIPRLNVLANVMPAEKATFVQQVQNPTEPTKANAHARRIVAFVGDGVNDSPALAAADVSIAMASGSDVAINSASFVLLNSELRTILHLVVLSRRVFNRVRMNFGWAVVYNLTLVPIAAGVLYPIVNGHKKEVVNGETVVVDTHWRLSPVWAALAMALSSISVVLSSLALGVEERVIRRVFRKE